MANYLDENGLSYFYQKLKAKFAKAAHTHPVGSTSGAACSVTPGTAASLTTESKSITPVTSKTVVVSETPMSATMTNQTLVITADVPTTGASVTSGAAVTWDGVGTFTPNTPTAVTPNTVVTAVNADTGTPSA